MRPFLASLLALSCSGDKDTTPTDVTDADTDTDADADTDTDSDTDMPTGDTGPVPGGDFAFVIRGNFDDCLIKWDVSHTPSSYACKGCPFTLDAQWDVTYALSEETTIEGCPEQPVTKQDRFVLESYAKVGQLTAELYEAIPVWAFASGLKYLPDTDLILLADVRKKKKAGISPTLYGPLFVDEATGAFSWVEQSERFEGYGVFDPDK
ncbi:MAG: hypothetical protein KTR31_09355 [Myxococcales bacterium]|nr:hypothetical protein [Myxococcales bacterium]